MLAEWDRKQPGRAWNIFNALSRVVPSHLMDRGLYDFAGLRPTGVPDPLGDTAFDPPDDLDGDEGKACADDGHGGEGAAGERPISFTRL